MNKQLKPCPFCGGKPSVGYHETESLWSHNIVTYTTVSCDECDILISTEPGYEFEAPAAWNRRPVEDELRAALEPFGKEADKWADRVPDEHRSLCTEPGSSTAHFGSETAFTIGDLRRARAALARAKGGA